jgi:hypothetical protein
VDVRIRAIESGEIRKGISLSEDIHRKLWKTTLRASAESPNFLAVGIFAQTLNGVFDAHTKRIFAAIDSRIPAFIWLVLYGVAMLGIGELGYQAALVGSSRSPTALGLIIAFAAVLALVVDLDRPQEGFLRINQNAMKSLRATMEPVTGDR